jgi:hypothetical protein
MQRFAAASVILLVAFSVAAADEFRCVIKKVDGNKVTLAKTGKKGDKPGEDMTLTAASSVKVSKITGFDKETKKVTTEDVKEGLKSDLFSKEARATVTTNDSGEITAIRIGGGRKGKGKNPNVQ